MRKMIMNFEYLHTGEDTVDKAKQEKLAKQYYASADKEEKARLAKEIFMANSYYAERHNKAPQNVQREYDLSYVASMGCSVFEKEAFCQAREVRKEFTDEDWEYFLDPKWYPSLMGRHYANEERKRLKQLKINETNNIPPWKRQRNL